MHQEHTVFQLLLVFVYKIEHKPSQTRWFSSCDETESADICSLVAEVHGSDQNLMKRTAATSGSLVLRQR